LPAPLTTSTVRGRYRRFAE